MKRIYCLTLFIAFCSITGFSQNDEINTIRNNYKTIKTDDALFHELKFNSVLPAIGPKQTSIKFYYEAIQINPEIDPYEMESKLKFIEVDYNFSGHTIYHTEYLFDLKEKLIFYFVKAEGSYENFEKRYYYKDEKLIKTIIKESDETSNSMTPKYSINEDKNAEAGKLNSLTYKDQFKAMLKLENIK